MASYLFRIAALAFLLHLSHACSTSALANLSSTHSPPVAPSVPPTQNIPIHLSDYPSNTTLPSNFPYSSSSLTISSVADRTLTSNSSASAATTLTTPSSPLFISSTLVMSSGNTSFDATSSLYFPSVFPTITTAQSLSSNPPGGSTHPDANSPTTTDLPKSSTLATTHTSSTNPPIPTVTSPSGRPGVDINATSVSSVITTSLPQTRSSLEQSQAATTTSNGVPGSTGGLLVPPGSTLSATITSVSPGFSVITIFASSLTANDWITTTNSEQHTTVLPFILTGPYRGVALLNLPQLPNVQYRLPGLPPFHMPCVRVFGVSGGDCTSPPDTDGPPPPGIPSSGPQPSFPASTLPPTLPSSGSRPSPPSPSNPPPESGRTTYTPSTATSRCAATTIASNCIAKCATSMSAQSCNSYTTSCLPPVTGCSVQGTTITITSESTRACFPRRTSLAAPAFPESTTGVEKRAIAGRITLDPIQKRGTASKIATLGSCRLHTPAALPLTRPAWPQPHPELLIAEKSGTMSSRFTVVRRYDKATSIQAGPCQSVVFTTTRLDANGFVNAPPWVDYNGEQGFENSRISLDHAYEKKWLKDFFEKLVNTLPTCADANRILFSHPCQISLIQNVWNEIASDSNLKFVAMSSYLNNEAKGSFFPNSGGRFHEAYVSPDYQISNNWDRWTWSSNQLNKWSAIDEWDDMIAQFQRTLYGVLELRGMTDLISETNRAIYTALVEFDANNRYAGDPTYVRAVPGGLAAAYKEYMERNVLPNIRRPSEYLSDLFEMIQTMGTESRSLPGFYYPEWQERYDLVNAHQEHYWDAATRTFSWRYDFNFDWTPMRHVKRSAGCPLHWSSSLVSSVQSTSLESSVQSSSLTSVQLSSLASSVQSSSLVSSVQSTAEVPTLTSAVVTPSPLPTPSACEGNQVQGSCTQASLPSSPPNSGPQAPVCIKPQGQPYVRFNATAAYSGAAKVCHDLIARHVVLDAQALTPYNAVSKTGAENGGSIVFTVAFYLASCNPGTLKGSQRLDFAAMGQDSCVFNLYKTISTVCQLDNSWPDYNAQYSLLGGSWAAECGLWSMRGVVGAEADVADGGDAAGEVVDLGLTPIEGMLH